MFGYMSLLRVTTKLKCLSAGAQSGFADSSRYICPSAPNAPPSTPKFSATKCKVAKTVINPPPTKNTTCSTSVHATEANPPYIEYNPAIRKSTSMIVTIVRSTLIPKSCAGTAGRPNICLMAKAPSQLTDVRLMNTYRNSQKMLNANPVPSL